ncbi:MAG: WYL domain-containing protein [Polyangiaceae bacterium]
MGQRKSTETVVAVFKAFLDQRTWSQADLARRVGVGVEALRSCLQELQRNDPRVTRDEDHPHVYWSVPKDWYPGAIALGEEGIAEMFRLVSRMPKSRSRTKVVDLLVRHAPALSKRPSVVVPPPSTDREDEHLGTLEDAATKKVSLRFEYLTMSKGVTKWRHASVHAVSTALPARFLATCHDSGTLKWFRVESVLAARLDEHEPYRAVDPAIVKARLRESLDGFHDGSAPTTHTFFVADPDSRWVAKNLLDGMVLESATGGIRVRVVTSGLTRLASFVVGLGSAATAETPELVLAVRALAQGALDNLPSAAGERGVVSGPCPPERPKKNARRAAAPTSRSSGSTTGSSSTTRARNASSR